MKGKRPNKTLLLVIAISLMLVLLITAFAACSTKTSTVTTTTTKQTTATSTATTIQTSTTTKVIKPITLIFSSHDAEGGSWAEIFDPFFAEIEQRTNGGILIEDHWNGELAGFFESYGTCADGTVDITQSQVQMYSNLFPMEDITTLVSCDVQCWARAQQWNELTKESSKLQEAFTNSNTKLLFRTSTYPNYAMMRTGAAIRSYDDFKGKKFLTTGKYDSLKWEALGMVPLSMQPDETFMNIQTGVCDGVYFSIPAVWDFGMTEILKSMTATNFAGGVFSCVMNLDTWNSLSAEYQQIITEAAAKVPPLQDAQQWRMHDEYKQKAADIGIEYIELPQSDLAKITESLLPIRASWVKEMEAAGLPGQQLLDDMLRLEKKYAGNEYKPK